MLVMKMRKMRKMRKKMMVMVKKKKKKKVVSYFEREDEEFVVKNFFSLDEWRFQAEFDWDDREIGMLMKKRMVVM